MIILTYFSFFIVSSYQARPCSLIFTSTSTSKSFCSLLAFSNSSIQYPPSFWPACHSILCDPSPAPIISADITRSGLGFFGILTSFIELSLMHIFYLIFIYFIDLKLDTRASY